jgi:hypothetical protein
VLRASTDKPSRFEVVKAIGVVQEVTGTEMEWTVPKESPGEGPRVNVFARIRAHATDGCGEILFSQPFMLI